MPTQVIVPGVFNKKNGGTVIQAGTLGGTNVITRSQPLSAIMTHGHGSIVKVLANLIQKIITAGTIGLMKKGKFVMHRQSTSLAGVDTNVLLFGGAGGFVDSIYNKKVLRSLLRRTAGWNWATGAYLSGPSTSTDNIGVDTAADANINVPARLQYTETGAAPKRTTYEASTSV